MAIQESISFDVLIERDINILLLEETRLSPAFQNWFVSKMTNGEMRFKRFIETVHLPVDSEVGTIDVLFLFENDQNRRCAFLIENKMDRPQEPVIARRYFDFGERGLYAGKWDEYLTCLMAPQDYFDSLSDDEFFSGYLSYEDLADWFVEAARSDSSLPPHRARYKEQFVRFALSQWDNIVQGLSMTNKTRRAARPVSPAQPPRSPRRSSSKPSRGRASFADADFSRQPSELSFDDIPYTAQQSRARAPFAPPAYRGEQAMPPAGPQYPATQPFAQPMMPPENAYPAQTADAYAAPLDFSNEPPPSFATPAAFPAQQPQEEEAPEQDLAADETPQEDDKELNKDSFSDFKLFPAGMLNLPPDYDEKTDSVMNVFTHDYMNFAAEKYPFLHINPPTPVAEKESIIECGADDFADGVSIVHRLAQNAVDLVFAGTPLSVIESAYKPFLDPDTDLKEAGNAAIIRIGVPAIDPQRGLDAQKDLVSFALGKAAKLHGLYLRVIGKQPSPQDGAADGKKMKDSNDLFF